MKTVKQIQDRINVLKNQVGAKEELKYLKLHLSALQKNVILTTDMVSEAAKSFIDDGNYTKARAILWTLDDQCEPATEIKNLKHEMAQ